MLLQAARSAPTQSIAELKRSAENMKRPLLIVSAIAIAVIAIGIFIGAPNSNWGQIKDGMKSSDIVAVLGFPQKDVLDSKSLQVWKNDGFIRTSSLVVLYYDQQNPEIATKVVMLDRWFWGSFLKTTESNQGA